MSNITFAPFPIPVVVDGIGDCYIVSQTNSSTFEDDLWVVAKCEGGQMLHVRTSQMKMHNNATIGIVKSDNTEWTTHRLVDWAAYYAAARRDNTPGSSFDILQSFKTKHNIK